MAALSILLCFSQLALSPQGFGEQGSITWAEIRQIGIFLKAEVLLIRQIIIDYMYTIPEHLQLIIHILPF